MIPSQAFQRLSQGPIFGHSTAVFPSGGVNCGESNYTLWWKLEYVQDVPNSRRSLLSRFSDPFNKWTGQSHPVIPPAWPESPPVRRDGSPSYSAQVESPSSPVDDDSKSSSAVDGPTMTTVLPSSVPTTLLGLNSSAVQFDTSAMPSAVKTCGGIRSFSCESCSQRGNL
ncbi:hypothetical protein BD324DRAFT_225131 [Kockovaella imperatae]|uniref:Uncharacterized protein n=1 Tax=Kockovaella imperatae TaxID=4999 RepID=A0A1Y1UNN6_9TREE|nr:hypothetical protein BD324DRAFT_225131 [Kockovaella imperatae]ORX39653.1 hypothetical protein BD324DRAFT_225131 [Kockovaella imperatae]